MELLLYALLSQSLLYFMLVFEKFFTFSGKKYYGDSEKFILFIGINNGNILTLELNVLYYQITFQKMTQSNSQRATEALSLWYSFFLFLWSSVTFV